MAYFCSYWDNETSGPFPGNIGPTTRCEFGYYLQEYLKAPHRRTFILGAPEDAHGVSWAKEIAKANRIKFHTLSKKDKHKLIPDSMVEAVTEALLNHEV